MYNTGTIYVREKMYIAKCRIQSISLAFTSTDLQSQEEL